MYIGAVTLLYFKTKIQHTFLLICNKLKRYLIMLYIQNKHLHLICDKHTNVVY